MPSRRNKPAEKSETVKILSGCNVAGEKVAAGQVVKVSKRDAGLLIGAKLAERSSAPAKKAAKAKNPVEATR